MHARSSSQACDTFDFLHSIATVSSSHHQEHYKKGIVPNLSNRLKISSAKRNFLIYIYIVCVCVCVCFQVYLCLTAQITQSPIALIPAQTSFNNRPPSRLEVLLANGHIDLNGLASMMAPSEEKASIANFPPDSPKSSTTLRVIRFE